MTSKEDLAYAWYLRHRPSSKWLQIDIPPPEYDGAKPFINKVEYIRDATSFKDRMEAVSALVWLMEDRPDYEILDYAVRPEPEPDADQTPVRTLDDVMADARRQRQAIVARQFHQATLTNAPPVGEQQRRAALPKGYGVASFGPSTVVEAPADAPLFPPRRVSPQ